MVPPQDENDAMFERFLEGDEELAAALAATGDVAEEGGEEAPRREEDVLAAGLHFVQHLRDMGE